MLARMLDHVDHVGIAVRDLDQAIEFYTKTFGVRLGHRERVEEQGVEEAMFRVGQSWIQLLQPLGDDTPVGKFIAKRGEGVHHVGYAVADVAQALDHLRGQGVPLIDETPRRGSRGATIAFVHPKGMGGVLVELVQEPGAKLTP
jgi:methylmalonyl-CoA/ethylmalonyl-CoA epimerase